MSIKGIDSQLMITRAAELMKDSSVQLKKNELMQDFLAVQSKVIEEHEKQKVARAQETQEAEIQLERDRDSAQGERQGGASKRKKEETQDPNQKLLEQLDSTGNHKIDIKI